MALATAGVALAAVPLASGVQGGLGGRIGGSHAPDNGLPDGGDGVMQALGGFQADLGVAFAAGLMGIREGGILDEALVSGLPIAVFRVAAVAVDTGHLAVLGLQKFFCDVDLFVRLQWSQRSASALTFGFSGHLGLAAHLFYFPAETN